MSNPVDVPNPRKFELVECAAAPDGTIMTQTSKYGRLAALAVFEMIGGTRALAEWAQRNPTDFYTKIFTKTISKEVEISAATGVDAIVKQLGNAVEDEDILDVDYAVVADAEGMAPSLDPEFTDDESFYERE